MLYYFAPMEGVTDSIYRSLHHKYFPGLDRYYTPFLSPGAGKKTTTKDSREIPAAQSLPFSVVPQVLTKSSEDFLFMAQKCADLGYQEINLNLGCPSGTVTAKGKGSGMLRDLAALDSFLYEIFSRTVLPVSIKTRIGFYDPEELPGILEIYNRYPIRELIVHPRVREDFYKEPIHRDAFSYALAHSKSPVCLNGNLCSLSQCETAAKEYPAVSALMLGRGLIGNPGMLTPGGTTMPALRSFLEELLETYSQVFGSERNAMFRMKENWRYAIRMFENSDKLFKKLRKSTDIRDYRMITAEIFSSCPIRKELQPDW